MIVHDVGNNFWLETECVWYYVMIIINTAKTWNVEVYFLWEYIFIALYKGYMVYSKLIVLEKTALAFLVNCRLFSFCDERVKKKRSEL